jgi:pimeloyl-ACP methyl ester carboxylesterase
VYNTSTLANKVRDAISAIRTLKEQPDVDPSRIVLRGVSEGTLLAAEVAVAVPDEVAGLVLSGVIGSNLKESLVFMVTDGAFLQHRQFWDTNGDGRISPQEFRTDPRGVRKQLPAAATFEVFDRDSDGAYTASDSLAINKALVDAIRAENFDIIVPVLEPRAAAQVPGTTAAWMADNFRQPPMWDLLSRISVPVGLFQGEDDGNTSAAEVRVLEEKAKTAGKGNLEFHYFAGLGHGLGTAEYFNTGTPSAGYAAIFEFMKKYSVAP